MEAVYIGIGTDDDLVPAEIVDIEGVDILFLRLCLSGIYLHAAAEYLYQIGDDLALEYAVIIDLKTVEYLTSDRHDRLKIRVARLYAGTLSRVALYDEELALVYVL